MTDRNARLLPIVTAEVERLHVFLGEWIRGDLGDDQDAFQRRFVRYFADDFVMIPAGGPPLPRGPMVEGLRRAQGKNAAFVIQIRDVRVLAASGDLVVAAYSEWQRGATTAPSPDNARVSTAAFRRLPGVPGGLSWIHLHESWIPPALIRPDDFAF